jgi:hypothetical protein
MLHRTRCPPADAAEYRYRNIAQSPRMGVLRAMHPGTKDPNKAEIVHDWQVSDQIVLNEHP